MQRRIRLLQQKHVDTATLDVRWWGAQGDGVTDDTPAIRAAVAARKALGPGTVYFPKPAVAYILQPQFYAYSPTHPVWTGCVTIDFSDVTFRGDPGGSKLKLRTYGGGNPDTDFQLIYTNSRDADDPRGPIAPALAWGPTQPYNTPGAVFLGPNGHHYSVAVAGTSGTNPAVFTTTPAGAGAIIDGTVTWALFDYVYKGVMFRIKSYVGGNTVGPGNIVFKDLVFDGSAPYRADVHGAIASKIYPTVYALPYDRAAATQFGEPPGKVFAGQGWTTPSGHRSVEMMGGFNIGAITFDNCVWTGWRSEVIYLSSSPGLITIKGGRITDCTADGLSFTAPALIEDLEIDHTSVAVENDPLSYSQTFRRLKIHDCLHGFVFPSNSPSQLARGYVLVEDSTVERCCHSALLVNGYMANVTFRRNRIIDCNTLFYLTNAGALWIYDSAGTPKNILISDCDFICDLQPGRGVIVSTRLAASAGNRIERCRFTRTPKSIVSGTRWQDSIVVASHPASEWTIEDCDCRGAINAPGVQGALASLYDPLPARITRCRTDGLAFEAPVAPYLDPRGYLDFTVAPAAPVVLTAARGFVVGTPTRIVISGNVTVLGSATLVLAAAGPWAPPAPGGESMFVRPAASPDKVFELPGARMGYT